MNKDAIGVGRRVICNISNHINFHRTGEIVMTRHFESELSTFEVQWDVHIEGLPDVESFGYYDCYLFQSPP